MELFPMKACAIESRRRGQQLVGPIDLTLEGQGATVVIGPNGAGKTTFLQLLHGTARLSAGRIDWACSTEEARHHQAFVFQRPVMLRRTVLENLSYPLRLRGVSKAKAEERARDWASRVGLAQLVTRAATVLSGGEQQKLALARALICDPKLLFLDEPCAALDGRAMREIETILQEAKAAGTRLILSTHDLGQARRLADDVLFLLGGRLHEAAPAEAFFNGPETPQARAFLRGDIVE
ncbi:ATP-binding cassette domain-containing protein [Sulfitobacter delicatus]|uniref:Phosphate ABC transporter ATP-binding protein, PhoT family n=1 Tax=Sulfitobacter delicatus TaxID=218672 RepID=A0A1G7T6A2_9RHOB|nr:ATP-binding cassette domain-containing protein [Sulfitobacter delicatus]SDG30159.1 phosphate ABC transporter ATP-binding protein, PhoT family [Sulfitobacter delicatus]